MFAENYFSEPQRRLMEINLEGTYVAQNLDLFATAGIHTAYTIDIENVIVVNRILNIHFGNDKATKLPSSSRTIGAILLRPGRAELRAGRHYTPTIRGFGWNDTNSQRPAHTFYLLYPRPFNKAMKA